MMFNENNDPESGPVRKAIPDCPDHGGIGSKKKTSSRATPAKAGGDPESKVFRRFQIPAPAPDPIWGSPK